MRTGCSSTRAATIRSPSGDHQIPPMPLQLLGDDELRETPMDVGIVVVRQDAARPAGPIVQGKLLHVKGPVHDVGHAASGRVEPRVERAVDRTIQRPSAAFDEIGDVDSPADDERGERERRVGIVGRDPGELLSHPLSPIPLFLGEVLPLFLGEVLLAGGGRVEDRALLPGGKIEHPQAARGIVPGPRADERHSGAVVGDPEAPGRAEREPSRSRLLSWERVLRQPRLPPVTPARFEAWYG